MIRQLLFLILFALIIFLVYWLVYPVVRSIVYKVREERKEFDEEMLNKYPSPEKVVKRKRK